jgi:hypothetical protein
LPPLHNIVPFLHFYGGIGFCKRLLTLDYRFVSSRKIRWYILYFWIARHGTILLWKCRTFIPR